MPDDSEVKSWLKQNGADDETIARFEKEKFTRKKDVDEAAIMKLVNEAGLQARLKRSIKAWTTPSIPPLPEGTTLDLSAPSFEFGGEKFELPAGLPAGSGKVESPRDLDIQTQWPLVAKQCNMMLGYMMDSVGTDVVRPEKPVLLWKVPADWDFMQPMHLASDTETVTTYDERSHKHVSAGFTKEAATASYLFASASFEHSRKDKLATSERHRDLYMSAMYRYPRARIFLAECSQVSPRFVAAVRDALARGDQAYAALEAVFTRYGHVVPTEVVLGGQLMIERIRKEVSTSQVSETETNWKAAASLQFEQLSAGGSFLKSGGEHDNTEVGKLIEGMSYHALGGDTTLATNPGEFSNSVKDAKLWTVIAIPKLQSTVELLPADLKAQVLALWKAHNPGGLPRPRLDGKLVSIIAAHNAWNPEKRVLAPYLPSARPGPCHLPMLDKKEQHKWIVAMVAPVAHDPQGHCLDRLLKSAGPHSKYVGRDAIVASDGRPPFVLPTQGFAGVQLRDSRVLANPHDPDTGWRLRYSGQQDTEHGGAPLFWIEHPKTGWLLAWDIVDKGMDLLPPVVLVDPAAMQHPLDSGMGALWRLDAVGTSLGAGYEDTHHLVHFATHRRLGVLGFRRHDIGDDERSVDGGPSLYVGPEVADEETLKASTWRLSVREA